MALPPGRDAALARRDAFHKAVKHSFAGKGNCHVGLAHAGPHGSVE